MSAKAQSLWDSDDSGGSPLKAEITSHPKVAKEARSKPKLFDSDSDEAKVTNKTPIVDYRMLYEEERAKRMTLEARVQELVEEVSRLKLAVLNLCCDGSHEEPSKEANEPVTGRKTEVDEHWEEMAREEKQRRQEKLRSMQAKQRAATANKRLKGKQEETVISAGESASILPANYVGNVSGGGTEAKGSSHYLFSSSEEEADTVGSDTKGSARTNSGARDAIGSSVGPLTAASVGGISLQDDVGDAVGASSALGLAPQETNTLAQGAADPPLDPEEAKWRELAAQEKQRKALARRSVRTVRRPAAAAMADSASSADQQTSNGDTVKRAQRQVRRANPLRAAIALSSGVPASRSGADLTSLTESSSASDLRAASALNAASPRGTDPSAGTQRRPNTSDDSDWSSEQSQSDKGGCSESGFSSEEDSSQPPAGAASSAGGTRTAAAPSAPSAPSASSGTTATADLGPEDEARMDARLRKWAGGRPVAVLLRTVRAALQESEGAVDLGELEAAVAPLSSGADAGIGDAMDGLVRKAYMRVIRCCHPDKHTTLPPRSAAFLELQKVFTALSEAYAAHKAANR